MGETAKLPDGSMFEFWEDETVYDIVLHVTAHIRMRMIGMQER